MGSTHLFAYGTLLTGTRNPGVNRLVARSLRALSRGCIRARLHDLGGYPGAVPSTHPQDRVYGYVFVLRDPETALAVLDWFEGYDRGRPATSHFVRRCAEVTLCPHGPPLGAWVYFYASEPGPAPPIRSGDYLDYVREPPAARS